VSRRQITTECKISIVGLCETIIWPLSRVAANMKSLSGFLVGKHVYVLDPLQTLNLTNSNLRSNVLKASQKKNASSVQIDTEMAEKYANQR